MLYARLHTVPDRAALKCMQALVQGVGAVGGHKEGLVPRAVALLHHLVQTSQHKGSLTVTQSGESHDAHGLAEFINQPMQCTARVSCIGMHFVHKPQRSLT